MKNTFGNNISYTLFGESHGSCVGIVIDGLPPGLKIDEDYIQKELNKRKAVGSISTARVEEDKPEFVSGVKNGFTEGTPVTIIIKNTNTRSADYSPTSEMARPGHADYTAEMKYLGYQDFAGGGHFSGRLTTPIVAAGAIIRMALEEKGIIIGSHILNLHGIKDDEFNDDKLLGQIKMLNEEQFAVINEQQGEKMIAEIEKARNNQDSVGGILETCVVGMPTGIGEPTFDSLESVIAHAMFSIGGIKGIEFGKGFGLAELYGSEANDSFRMNNGVVTTTTNNNGGINGGISNGMPIVFRTVVKPTSSISRVQDTINFKKMENTTIEIKGRHDPAIIHRARAVVDAMTAIALAELLTQRHGYMWLRGELCD